MTTLKQIRGFYVHATDWDFDSDVQPHIEKMRRIQAEEFDSLLAEVKADAWDDGFHESFIDANATNPYRKGN